MTTTTHSIASSLQRMAVLAGLAVAAGCDGPSADGGAYGTYEARVSFMAFGSTDVQKSNCHQPLAVQSSDAEVVLERGESATLVFQGCRIAGVIEGAVFRASDAACVPASASLSFLAARVYHELEFDTKGGTLTATSSSLGTDGEGRCSRVDGLTRKIGSTTTATTPTYQLSSYTATFESTSELLSTRLRGEAHGYVEQLGSGRSRVLGFGCTFGDGSGAGESMSDIVCDTGFDGAFGVPEFQANAHTVSESEISISGEFVSPDGSFTYSLGPGALNTAPF